MEQFRSIHICVLEWPSQSFELKPIKKEWEVWKIDVFRCCTLNMQPDRSLKKSGDWQRRIDNNFSVQMCKADRQIPRKTCTLIRER